MKVHIHLVNLAIVIGAICGAPAKKKCKAANGKFFSLDDSRPGKCKRCETCPAGQEWDLNANISTSAERGDLECYPCTACKGGYYKDRDILPSCSPCLLKCDNLNRYLAVQCGGVIRGHCGSCKPGFEDLHANSEMSCTKIRDKVKANIKTQIYDHVTASTTTIRPHMSSDFKDIIFFCVCGLVIAVVGVVIVVALRKYLIRRPNRNEQHRIPIDAQVFSSGAKLVQDTDNADSDVDVDGPQARAELQTDTRVCSLNSRYIKREEALSFLRRFPSIILTKDDHLLSVISKHIYGEMVEFLFQKLDVSLQIVYSEKTLWEQRKQHYKDYILNVLINWVNKAERNATLEVLCEALYEVNFKEALEEVEKELETMFRYDDSGHNRVT